MVRFSIRFDIRFFDVGTGKSNGRVFTRYDFASDSAFDFLFGEQVLCILLSRLLKIIEIMSMKVQNFSVNVPKTSCIQFLQIPKGENCVFCKFKCLFYLCVGIETFSRFCCELLSFTKSI